MAGKVIKVVSASKSSDAAASSTVAELSHVGQEQETDADAATSNVGSNGNGFRHLMSQPCGLERRYVLQSRPMFRPHLLWRSCVTADWNGGMFRWRLHLLTGYGINILGLPSAQTILSFDPWQHLLLARVRVKSLIAFLWLNCCVPLWLSSLLWSWVQGQVQVRTRWVLFYGKLFLCCVSTSISIPFKD